MTSDPVEPSGASPRRLPAGATILAGLLLVIPLVALAMVPVYAKDKPRLWGFPFFYWYQFLWVFLTAALTWAAYVVVTRARRGGAR
jgi:hypothetical protein